MSSRETETSFNNLPPFLVLAIWQKNVKVKLIADEQKSFLIVLELSSRFECYSCLSGRGLSVTGKKSQYHIFWANNSEYIIWKPLSAEKTAWESSHFWELILKSLSGRWQFNRFLTGSKSLRFFWLIISNTDMTSYPMSRHLTFNSTLVKGCSFITLTSLPSQRRVTRGQYQ